MSAKFQLGHAKIDKLNRRSAVDAVIAAAESGKPYYVVTPNSDHLVRLESDENLRQIYSQANLVIADGMPLVWASRLLGNPLEERVTGADLMPAVCEEAAKRGLSIFMMGAPEGVAIEAQKRLEKSYPGLKVVGAYSPPYGFEKDKQINTEIIEMINAAAPDIIFVGLGAPKQESWIHQNHQKFSKGAFLGIGASIDFIAGNVKRAPLWVQKSGFEWMYRLLQEPGRLAKRYAADTYVLWIILREVFRKRSYS
ncbi:MAG: glycosyltransferase [Proteobacteria bacterium]|nr:MAG: glycosyltransferase [Pseudomonadota bacterium]